jgi:hypothetical protein
MEDIHEKMLECLEIMENEPMLFTAWEQNFLESIEETIEVFHLTDEQEFKVLQIHERVTHCR